MEGVNHVLARYNEDPKVLDDLYVVVTGGIKQVSNRAAWFMNHVFDRNPELINAWIYTFLEFLENNEPEEGIIRSMIRPMQSAVIPEELKGRLAELCFNYLNNPQKSIAVRVFSMSVLENITKSYPEMAYELRVVIENHLPNGSAGFKNRGMKIIKRMDKLIEKLEKAH